MKYAPGKTFARVLLLRAVHKCFNDPITELNDQTRLLDSEAEQNKKVDVHTYRDSNCVDPFVCEFINVAPR